jgi:hypothetical protein
VIGTGPGRGIALLLVVIGAVIVAHTVLSYLSPRIRNVEDELPDALPERDAASEPLAASPAAPG